MPDESISGFSESTNPSSAAVVPVVEGGENKRVTLANLTKALTEATGATKGLMSAEDKAAFDVALEDIAGLLAGPVVQTIASASTITIPPGTDVVKLTGTTDVVTVNTPNEYKIYTVHYPSGAGLSFQGTALTAGQALLAIGTHS